MQIHELPAVTATGNTTVLAVDDGTTTEKVTVANLGKKITEDAEPEFTSADETGPTAWKDTGLIRSGLPIRTILNRLSSMISNVRWLYKMLGTTDISAIGDGTVTGAISKFNTALPPVGGVVVTSTNINPSAQFGGTWTLIDKQFAEYTTTDTSLFVKSANTSSVYTSRITRLPKSIQIILEVVTGVALADDSVDIGYFSYSDLGVQGTTGYRFPGVSDGGNGMISFRFTADSGTYKLWSDDVVVKGGGTSIPSGSYCSLQCEFYVPMNSRVDANCDKFFWKRTA